MKESGIMIIGSLEPGRKYQDNVRVVSGGCSPCLLSRDYKDPIKVIVYEETNKANRNS